MANKNWHSTRYFQLTSEVLMEYKYTDLAVRNNQTGDVDDYIVDMNDYEKDFAGIVTNNFNSTNNFYFISDNEHLVQPINSSESKFILCYVNNNYINLGQDMKFNELTDYIDTKTDDIIYDQFRLHFTSRNYFGDYDGFIIRCTLYDKVKNKISLLNYYIRKTDDVQINQDPILINQKLYTTYLDFRIPSSNALLTLIGDNSWEGEENLKGKLFTSYEPMDNSPISFTIYGVKSTYNYMNTEIYNVEKLNTIYIPVYDGYSNLSVTIKEATDGDYFKIYPEVSDGTSFSDYIYNISNGRPDTYIVLHELTLTEYWTNYNNTTQSKVTHREHYIVNAASVDDQLQVNEEELERVMIYRPVIMYSGRLIKFMIEDQMKILNTLDNTTTIKIATFDSSEHTGCNPKKYGKNISKIYLGEIPAQVNVYNKKPDNDTGNVNITNSSSTVTIENHQNSIIGFIECANIGVSIEQVTAEDVETQ